MSLISNIINPGPAIYYDNKFRNIFEDHLNLIINNNPGAFTVVNIDPNTGARYAGDWRGLMLELSVFPQMHWFNMRVNGYTSTSDYNGDQLSITILNVSVVDRLISSYKTLRKN